MILKKAFESYVPFVNRRRMFKIRLNRAGSTLLYININMKFRLPRKKKKRTKTERTLYSSLRVIHLTNRRQDNLEECKQRKKSLNYQDFLTSFSHTLLLFCFGFRY